MTTHINTIYSHFWPLLYTMLINLLIVFVSLGVLAVAADKFVIGASAIANQFGVSPLLIGITIVSFGTSAPEIFVSITAALNDNPELAIGNAVGSNIANIALVLGLAIVFAPTFLHVNKQVVAKEMPIMLGVTVAAFLFLIDGMLQYYEAVLLIVGLVVFIIYAVYVGKSEKSMQAEAENPLDELSVADLQAISVTKAWLLLLGGLIFMAASSQTLVISASSIARTLGVSDLVIGLTIVAIGTSLPEVAASVASALKQETELALGNVIGSNIFNLLAVVGIAGVISPVSIDPAAIYRDIPVMLGLTLLLFILIKPWNLLKGNRHKTHHLTKPIGYMLLLCYFGYLGLILFTL